MASSLTGRIRLVRINKTAESLNYCIKQLIRRQSNRDNLSKRKK